GAAALEGIADAEPVEQGVAALDLGQVHARWGGRAVRRGDPPDRGEDQQQGAPDVEADRDDQREGELVVRRVADPAALVGRLLPLVGGVLGVGLGGCLCHVETWGRGAKSEATPKRSSCFRIAAARGPYKRPTRSFPTGERGA